jgi:indole-3-glycerol phosphate synthase
VNSRNLRTLEVSPEKVAPLLDRARRAGAIVVAESGVRDRSSVESSAHAGADAVLVGEALMRSEFPEDVLQGLTGVIKRSKR